MLALLPLMKINCNCDKYQSVLIVGKNPYVQLGTLMYVKIVGACARKSHVQFFAWDRTRKVMAGEQTASRAEKQGDVFLRRVLPKTVSAYQDVANRCGDRLMDSRAEWRNAAPVN